MTNEESSSSPAVDVAGTDAEGRLAEAPADSGVEKYGADAVYLARLDRLLRTAERMRSLAEKILVRAGATSAAAFDDDGPRAEPPGQGVLREISADAAELKGLAEDVVLLGYTFREVKLDASFRFLAEWTGRLRAPGGQRPALRIAGDGLQMDHRLAPVLRARMQELIRLLLELSTARSGAGLDFSLEAHVEGRSLRVQLGGAGLTLDAAELMHCARRGGFLLEGPDPFLRQPGRLMFHPAFAAGCGLPPDWTTRLLRLRDRLRQHRGDLEVRDSGNGGFCFSLRLPLLADLAALLIVRCGDRKYGVPIEAVFSTRVVAPPEWRLQSGCLWLETPLPLPAQGFDLPTLPLQGPAPGARVPALLSCGDAGLRLCDEVPGHSGPVLLLEDENGLGALLVDEVLGERQILLHHPRSLLRRVRHLMGSVLLPSEEVCVVLHPWDLLRTLRTLAADWTQ